MYESTTLDFCDLCKSKENKLVILEFGWCYPTPGSAKYTRCQVCIDKHDEAVRKDRQEWIDNPEKKRKEFEEGKVSFFERRMDAYIEMTSGQQQKTYKSDEHLTEGL
jgi:hypothetical protein